MYSNPDWDYILVGLGTAGCAFIFRLLQHDPDTRILVLESGPDLTRDPVVLNVQGIPTVVSNPMYTTSFLSQTDPQIQRQYPINFGRMVGNV